MTQFDPVHRPMISRVWDQSCWQICVGVEFSTVNPRRLSWGGVVDCKTASPPSSIIWSFSIRRYGRVPKLLLSLYLANWGLEVWWALKKSPVIQFRHHAKSGRSVSNGACEHLGSSQNLGCYVQSLEVTRDHWSDTDQSSTYQGW